MLAIKTSISPYNFLTLCLHKYWYLSCGYFQHQTQHREKTCKMIFSIKKQDWYLIIIFSMMAIAILVK